MMEAPAGGVFAARPVRLLATRDVRSRFAARPERLPARRR